MQMQWIDFASQFANSLSQSVVHCELEFNQNCQDTIEILSQAFFQLNIRRSVCMCLAKADSFSSLSLISELYPENQ